MKKFLRKLFQILDDSAFSSIITWNSTGEHFLILDHEALEKHVIPAFFSLKKYSSFIRQLHLYHFKKEKTVESFHTAYQNPHFLRDERIMAENIERNRKKGSERMKQEEGKKNTEKGQVLWVVSEINQKRRDLSLDEIFSTIQNEQDLFL